MTCTIMRNRTGAILSFFNLSVFIYFLLFLFWLDRYCNVVAPRSTYGFIGIYRSLALY